MHHRFVHRLVIAASLAAALLVVVPDADAGGRQRGRQVSRQPGSASVATSGTTARGDVYSRGRSYGTDGNGNLSGGSRGSVTGVNGGSASRQGSMYRNSDGSAGRQGNATATGPNGGSATSSGAVTRNADGSVSGARSTSATAANGATYHGSTTYQTGQGVQHTATCTNAAGQVVPCRDGG